MTTDNIRKNFPLLQQMDTIYLDNAATAQRPSCVLVAVQEFYEQKNANPLRGFYPLSLEATESYQEARKTVQEFIHAEEPEEIIFTRNTTESLNLVAYSYGLNFLKEGDEIAVTIMEHHSNLLPWQMVSRMTGAKLHYLECTSEGELTDEELQKGINERTRLVAVAQASADIMLGMIIGKTKDEALRLGNLFLRMIKGEASDEEIDELEEAGALKDISHMPARVKCAVLGWHTMEKLLDHKDEQ